MATDTQPTPSSVPTEHAAQQLLLGYLQATIEDRPITVDEWNRGVKVARLFEAKPAQGVGFRG